MYGLAVMVAMSLSGHLSNIDENTGTRKNKQTVD